LENFNYPYLSQSIREFWRRWHISLSNWLRDYLYIPLGGNRRGTARSYMNLVLVFLLCGLWHGASWNFLLWGAYHGVFLVIERLGVEALLKKLWAPVRHFYALLVVMLGWVFFRAETLAGAGRYIGRMFGGGSEVNSMMYPVSAYIHSELVVSLLLGIVFAAPTFPILSHKLRSAISRSRGALKPVLFAVSAGGYATVELVVLLVAAAALASGTHNPFIYFRF
jgi:alginate O-acetyltransferase complex protein AlgI